jgi:hypothetical protein
MGLSDKKFSVRPSIVQQHQQHRNNQHETVPKPLYHKLNMELDLQSLFGLLFTAVLIG